jgi:hypothetical protein
MREMYGKCIEDGSVAYTAKELKKFVNATLSAYRSDERAYEMAANFWLEQSDYAECYKTIRQAEDFMLMNDRLADVYAQIRYKYKISGSRYDDYLAPYDEVYAIHGADGWSFVRAVDGNLAIDGAYETASRVASELIAVNRGGAIRLLDGDGIQHAVAEDSADGATVAGYYANGVVPVEMGGQYYYLDASGELSEDSYEHATSFSCGLAAFKAGGAWTVVDEDFNAVAQGFFGCKAAERKRHRRQRLFLRVNRRWLPTVRQRGRGAFRSGF